MQQIQHDFGATLARCLKRTVARVSLPCYTSLARVAFRRRAKVVPQSNFPSSGKLRVEPFVLGGGGGGRIDQCKNFFFSLQQWCRQSFRAVHAFF